MDDSLPPQIHSPRSLESVLGEEPIDDTSSISPGMPVSEETLTGSSPSSDFEALSSHSFLPSSPPDAQENQSIAPSASTINVFPPNPFWDFAVACEETWATLEDARTPSRNAFSASATETGLVDIIGMRQVLSSPHCLGVGHSGPCDGGIDGFCLLCALRDRIESSLAISAGILSPLKFVDNLNYTSRKMLMSLCSASLDKLKRCFLHLKKKNKSREKDDSLVQKVFGGRLISQLRCCNCGHCSDTYEPLIDLSLEIENVDNLPSALESFTKVEMIDAKFRCYNCNEVSMEKQLILDQTPSVASFYLKRFKIDGTNVEKIDNHVQFPLELDLQP